MEAISSFLETLTAFAMATLGALMTLRIGISHRQLCALISFAGGTLLGVSVFHVVPHSLEETSTLFAAIGFFSGLFLFFILSRFVHICPACAASHLEAHTKSELQSIGIWLGVAFVIHNLIDGMAIEASGMRHHFGPSIFLGILLHKLPEGIALCALFLKGGFSQKRAFVWTILFEFTTVVGWFIGNFFLKSLPDLVWVDFILLHAAGGFTYLALHAVWNEAREHSPKMVLSYFSIGLLLMASLRSLPH